MIFEHAPSLKFTTPPSFTLTVIEFGVILVTIPVPYSRSLDELQLKSDSNLLEDKVDTAVDVEEELVSFESLTNYLSNGLP